MYDENGKLIRVHNTRVTQPSYRNPQTIVTTARTLQLLIKRLNEIGWIALTGQHIVTSSLLVVCAFSTIHFFGLHNFGTIPDALGYLIFPAAFCIFFIWVVLVQPQAANLKIHSQFFRAAWKKKEVAGNVTSKEMSKFVNSFHDLEVYVGCFFCYQVSTMPKVFDICVGHTITFLLTA